MQLTAKLKCPDNTGANWTFYLKFMDEKPDNLEPEMPENSDPKLNKRKKRKVIKK